MSFLFLFLFFLFGSYFLNLKCLLDCVGLVREMRSQKRSQNKDHPIERLWLVDLAEKIVLPSIVYRRKKNSYHYVCCGFFLFMDDENLLANHILLICKMWLWWSWWSHPSYDQRLSSYFFQILIAKWSWWCGLGLDSSLFCLAYDNFLKIKKYYFNIFLNKIII